MAALRRTSTATSWRKSCVITVLRRRSCSSGTNRTLAERLESLAAARTSFSRRVAWRASILPTRRRRAAKWFGSFPRSYLSDNARRAQQTRDFARFARIREERALPEITSERDEPIQLLPCFDAFARDA